MSSDIQTLGELRRAIRKARAVYVYVPVFDDYFPIPKSNVLRHLRGAPDSMQSVFEGIVTPRERLGSLTTDGDVLIG